MSISRSFPDDLPRHQVAIAVLGKLVGEDEQAIERCAQFVRHVRQEFRFVLRREGKLLGLVLQSLAGLLNLLVLTLNLHVLVSQETCLLLKLHVLLNAF
jgi:hypothetical protein